MASIHFICRDWLNLKRISDDVWESGDWNVSEADAETLIGGMIYLHERKRTRSYFGGEILSYRIVYTDNARPERIVFRFRVVPDARGEQWAGASHAMAWTSGVLPY